MAFWKRKKDAVSSSVDRKNKVIEFLPLFAGIGLTLLAIFVARQRISDVEKNILGKTTPTDIVVAARVIPAGETFTMESLAKKTVPSEATSRRHVPATDFELLLDAKAKVEIPQGEPVLWTDIEEPVEVGHFSDTIPIGRRAITIDTDTESSFSGLVRPGDRVDILRKEKTERTFVPLLFDIPVIAVNRRYLPGSPGEDGNDIHAVTLSVSPAEASRLSVASREGTLSWLLRNPDDRSRTTGVRVLPEKGSPPVEIWKAGIRERKLPDVFEERVFD